MDFSHLYRTNIKKTLDEDRADIVAQFQEIVRQGTRVGLRLVNYYKGLPLSYPATLVEMDRGTLELDVHQQQAVALNASRYTFIKCDAFVNPILAEVQNVNVRRMAVSLNKFVFVDIMAEQRNALRLELEPPTDAQIKGESFLVSGKVFDISLGGCSIVAAERCELAKAEQVTLTFFIPNLLQDTQSSVEVPSRHVETLSESGADICRFTINADAQSEALISRYVFQRQVEIIRELKEQK